MLKNLNDYISFAVLVVLSLFSLKYFFAVIFEKQNENLSKNSTFYDFIHYVDNEDE